MPRTDSNTVRVDDAQQNYQQHKEEFEKLRSDVIVKLKFLDENRVSIFLNKCLKKYHSWYLSMYFLIYI
jgi:hypothetical protein